MAYRNRWNLLFKKSFVFIPENDIDGLAFSLLTSNDINQMIQSTGLRLKFEQEFYKLYLKKDPKTRVTTERPVTIDDRSDEVVKVAAVRKRYQKDR